MMATSNNVHEDIIDSLSDDSPVASLMYSICDLEMFESTRFYDWSWFYRYIEEN